MSQTMTVERVVKENEWEGKYGKNQAYSLDLKMPDGRVEMGVTSNRKLKEDGTHNEPQEGEVLVGTIEPDGRGGEKLRIDYDATKELNQGGRPQFSSSESSTASKPSSKGETDWAAIGAEKRRCHSQEMAVRMCVAMDLLREGADWAHHIRAFANWFDEDAIAAGQRASQGQLPPSGQTTESQTAAPEQSSVDFSGARREEPSMPDDSHQWLESLLVVAGAADHAAPVLAKYAVQKLRPDQQKTLEAELNDHDNDAKLAGLRRVEASYVKTEGHPIPAPQDDPTIPF